MAWFLNPALTRFRAEVNAEYPARDKASDGTIGDEAHQSGSSDHNPDPDGSVDAFDCDVHLYGASKPAPAAELERLKGVFQRHEASSYWIHNDQIARRANAWRREPYANYAGPGRNRHTQHIHFNSRQSHENSTRPWGVHVALTIADANLVVDTLLTRMLGSSGPTVGVALQSGYYLDVQIAQKVDIDAAELLAITAAAEAGVVAAADELAAAIVAALPPVADGGLTTADVEAAVRKVFADAGAP